eukprot:TRINITY_DN26200_c0_g1_i1.p1 TRINITY_DN26200_c0_g1~~TRINITY_DN26200_c0_g1_i1.p1  ORF type:complete len:157 (+),score=32.00 TRINITY_DN26200_c0_g1_i1:50-472(+)
MFYSIFSLVYKLFQLVIWTLKISWKLVILLTLLNWVYLCILKIHSACKYLTDPSKKKAKQENIKVIENVQEMVYESSFNISAYEDDIHPEDSVSVVSAYPSKESDGSVLKILAHYKNPPMMMAILLLSRIDPRRCDFLFL